MMLNFTAPKQLSLRPYQMDAVEALRDGIRAGQKRQILVAPTGAGKTVIASHLLNEADRKGSYALFMVDRVALVDQTSQTLDDYGINHGIVQGINERWAPNENVQVCSVQTLARRCLPRSPSLIIYDEAHCFVAGTKIKTPDGDKSIEKIGVGDSVFTASGIGYVRHSFYNNTKELVKVIFDDGTEITCTPNHRFFTGNAWVEARFLDGQSAFGIESMPGLWRGLSSEDIHDSKGELARRTRGLLAQKNLLLSKLCEEIEEPDAQPEITVENGGIVEAVAPYAEGNRREWPRDHRAAASSFADTWSRLATGICCSDRGKAGRRYPEPLDNRHRERDQNDSNRGGRGESQRHFGQGEGSSEGRILGVKRVVSVESVQCGRDTAVYNLHVSGHPSYFANGVLVHNCQYKDTLAYIEANPQAVAIGLTATPFTPGMGMFWNRAVNVTTTAQLVKDGFLIEPKIFVAKSPEDDELGLNGFGEFTDNSAGAAGIRIVGDVVKEWVKKTAEFFGGPAKTIVFSPTVEHGRELCAAFSAAGFNFQQISYLDRNEDERKEKIREFRREDSLIHGLVSCGVLTKGFDVPDVRVGISCKPYRKSLSSHLQEIGRVMRTAPGKDIALWLDHSGNIERFALDQYDVWENGCGDLSHAEKRDATPRKRDQQTHEKVVCPECGGVLRGNACLACGWEKPARSGIIAVEGELKAFDIAGSALVARSGLRAACLAEPKSVWNAALCYCLEHSRDQSKARKWAYGVWRGVYPDAKLPTGWFDAAAMEPKADAYALIDREVKRFRKSNSRRAA